LPKIPQPLQIPPSRARRQFALRLAQRKAQLESTREQEEDPESTTHDDDDPAKAIEQEEREGHQRFARMFEGIDDSSDDESLGSFEGLGERDEGVVGGAGGEAGETKGEQEGSSGGCPKSKEGKDDSERIVV